MAGYSVFLKASAAEELENVARVEDRRRILEKIEGLADDPRPAGSIKLAGRDDRRRIRQGDYRIVYSVDDPPRTVTVVKIGHRKNLYR
ncbi:MAG: type II toxin-antitoxin system RelE family toxin [Gemmatimonadota bacterium]